ncbi:MAG TPA: tyrosine-type recombinase/integrase [Chitinophagaceae bacterium]|nr:tyrosine-type recombinase/integrase [Chitinophagaceae bacterium]
MPSSTFVLKEPTSKEPTLVYLIFRFNNTRLKYSTGQKINPKFWNPKKDKQRAKETRQFPGYSEFNSLLDNLESAVHNQYRKLLNDRLAPTPDLLRIPLDEILQKGNGKAKDLVAFAEYLVENTDRKPGTKKQLRQTIRNLKEFKQETKRSLHLDSIDLEFYDLFVDFLIRKDYGKNTVGTAIKNIKVFMNEAVDRNLTNNLQYKNRRFKNHEESSETIYLSENEIKRLNSLELNGNTRLEKVRDLFIIACYTGLRFSDLIELRMENINKQGSLVKIRTKKTGEIVIIPLRNHVKDILNRYKGEPPKAFSNQKMNEYLKELGQLADISEDVVITGTKGGVRKSEAFKKWELITTHTARRSFATNAYLANVPTISIMKITGHKTEKSFLKYIKISQEDNANKLLNHPFFK